MVAARHGIGNRPDASCTASRRHGVNLVHRFPPRCPLAPPNPLETLKPLQNASWRVIGRGVHDPELPDALTLLDAKDMCMRCTDRNLTHPTVRQLRAGKAVAA